MTDEIEPERCAKKVKLENSLSLSWILYPPEKQSFHLHDIVFYRSKSSKEKGRRGVIMTVDQSKYVSLQWCDDNQSIQRVRRNRILPIFLPQYSSSTSPVTTKERLDMATVIVTPDTTNYRLLCASQVTSNDIVLELGCSSGQASLILIKYAKSWVGLDTSEEMIELCRREIAARDLTTSPHVYKVDALIDPEKAKELVLNATPQNLPPTHVFIDIGGNRAFESVLHMISWVTKTFHPLLVVVKCQELSQNLQSKEESAIESQGRDMAISTRMLQRSLNSFPKIPSHPLKAPLRYVTDRDIPICRYHNYHKDGCSKYSNGSCLLDHDHCHLCLENGHIARQCPKII
jgi:precorrin-6B methylase 2